MGYRKVTMTLTFEVRAFTEEEREDEQASRKDCSGAVKALDPQAFAEQVVAFLEQEDAQQELLAGSEMFVKIHSVEGVV